MIQIERIADEIAADLGLDDSEIAQRKRFLELDEDAIALLREAHDCLEPERERFASAFYDHLMQFPPLRAMIGDESAIDRLRQKQSRYFSSLTEGDYGSAYVRERLRVGITHHRIGLEPKWYIGAYRKYLTELIHLLAARYADDPARYSMLVDAILKAVLFDMGLALETYFHHEHKEVVREHQDVLRFRAALDMSPDALLVIDPVSMYVVDANETASRMYGLSRVELIGASPESLKAEFDTEQLAEAYARLLADPGRIQTLETLARRKDSSLFPVEISRCSVRWGKGWSILVAIRDVSGRKKAEERLGESEALYRSTFEDAPVGVAHVGLDGRWLRVNQKLCDITGYSPAEMLRLTCPDMTHPDNLASDIAGMEKLLNGKIGVFDREKQYLCKNGTLIWVHQRTSLFRGADGQPKHFIAVTTDVSQRKTAEDEILRLNQSLEQRVSARTGELQAANQELAAFNYSLSHDLRESLRAVLGFTHLLEDDCGAQMTPPCRGHLERIGRAANRMNDLIEDMLGLFRIGSAPLDRQPVDLADIARDIFEQLSQSQPDRQVGWTVSAPLPATGDAGLLRAVLENLIGNAWKYTSRQARSEIAFGAESDESGNTVFFVRDNGAGFDMKYADKLFQPFQRLHHPNDFPGTGVGLATVLRIVQRHGGRIWAEAEPGKGATFHFTLGESFTSVA